MQVGKSTSFIMTHKLSCNDTIMNMCNYVRPSINKLVHDGLDSGNDEMNSIEKTPLKRVASVQNCEEGKSAVKKFKDNTFDLDYVGSPRETRKIRADLIEARNTILDLENRINHMHGIRKEMEILFDNEMRSLKKERDYDRKSVLELENQLLNVRKREYELKEELTETKNKYNSLKVSSDQKIEVLEKKLCDISTETKAQDADDNSAIASLKRTIMELKSNLQIAEEEVEKHQKLYQELEKELNGKSSVQAELEIKNKEIQKLRLQLKEYEYIKQNYVEYQEQAKSQARKLARYIEIEKENEKLKEENCRIKDDIKNKLVLEEEVHDLKKRLQHFREQESTFANVQMQLVQMEMYLNEWKAIARSIVEVTAVNDTVLPHLLRSTVERLQQQELSLTDQKVNLQSQLNNAQHESKLAKEELSKIQELLTKLRAAEDQKNILIQRMKRKLTLVSRERDSYRLQLDSYERDLTMSVNISNLGSQAASQVQNLRERVETLEKSITDYRDLVAKLEADLQNAEHTNADLPPVKVEQLSRLQNEVDRLKHENEQLRGRKDQLEIQLEDYLVGNDTLRGGNVYHLANNPLSECLTQREALITKLEEQVDKLKRKVKNMEEGIEHSKIVDISLSTKEVQILKEELKNKESQSQALKEHFKSSMQDLRDAVYSLLGYKIDRNTKSLYKLTSIYAENANDYLTFQWNSSGHMNLLETEYSSTLEDLIDLHLRQQNSIPNFLSSLTLDLYSSRTMCTEQIELNDD